MPRTPDGALVPPSYAMRPDPYIGMSDPEIDRYSLCRAILAAKTGDWRSAGMEDEASRETARLMQRQPRGFYVPFDWMKRGASEQRDLTKATVGAGGYMVGTELMGDSFIDRLTAKMVMAQAGVTTLTGLIGDVAIPRLATGPTAYWVAENVAITEGAQTFEQVTMTPKTCGAFLDLSRRLLQQASLDVENMVRNDAARSLALAMDLAILQGTGTDQPTGVKGVSGVTDKSTTNGDTLTWAIMVGLETAVATANADNGRFAYITNPTMRGVMKNTLITATYGDRMIWDQSQGNAATPVNGCPCFITSQIPANLTKGGGTALSYIFAGNWADVLIGSWGSLDVLVDPYSGGTAGTVRVICFNDVDVAVRHPGGFVFGYYK